MLRPYPGTDSTSATRGHRDHGLRRDYHRDRRRPDGRRDRQNRRALFAGEPR